MSPTISSNTRLRMADTTAHDPGALPPPCIADMKCCPFLSFHPCICRGHPSWWPSRLTLRLARLWAAIGAQPSRTWGGNRHECEHGDHENSCHGHGDKSLKLSFNTVAVVGPAVLPLSS